MRTMRCDPEITPELLLRAYAAGIFPMAERRDADELLWISPHVRGVIPLHGFHVPRRLARTVKSDRFEVHIDNAFAEVIRACAAPALGRDQSWINAEIVSLYSNLYERGSAHSVECWSNGVLVGGLYGVTIGAAFFGESMFSRERDASKIALVHLVARLIHGGFELLDAQFLTNHLAQFGAVGLEQQDYLRALNEAIGKKADFYRPASAGKSGSLSFAPASGEVGFTGAVEATVGAVWPGWFVLQLITQTS